METKMRLIWTDYKFKRGFSFLEREREREREFQLIRFAFDDSFLSSDHDTNQFLV